MASFDVQEWRKENYLVTTDAEKQDIAAIHRYLTRSTWAVGIDRETVAISVQNSLNFGLFHGDEQIGFARLVTDYATFAYLCDVYVLEAYQGQKLGKWLITCCHAHPVFEKLRRIVLFTSTAPWLYAQAGYVPINRPDYTWTIARPDIYKSRNNPTEK